ncbi:retrovirus-related pol polyprotein from transposon TNT 1-94 [Tanacetum coccineum]
MTLSTECYTQVPRPSDPTESVAYEAIHKELGDSLVWAATTAFSLEAEQDSGNITKTQSKETPNESSSIGTTSVWSQGRINAIDADEEITLVSVQDDADKEMFDVDALNGEEVFVAGQNENVVEEVVDAAQVSTAATTVTITTEEITLAQALEALKTSKPKVKGIVFQEPEEPVKPIKKKDLTRLDEEFALKLQVEFDKEERLTREKAEKEQEANIALIETWDDIQAKIDADHQLAERLQAQEQEELSVKEKATLFQQLLEKRRKHFTAKRAEEKRNKPPTKAQQRKIMCTYLKNMEGYKLNDLKLKDFDSIQEMFDRAFKRVNTFEDFRTELVEDEEEMEALLGAQDAWEFVTTEYEEPTDAEIGATTANQLKALKEKPKQAWDTLEKAYKGADRVKQVRLRTLRGELEAMRMKETEGVSDYITQNFENVVCVIEESKDLEDLTIEELAGSMEAHEKRKNKKKGRGCRRGGQGYRLNVDCYNCGKHGHYAKDCRSPKRTKEKNHLVTEPQVEESGILLMAHEEQILEVDTMWYLDSGASNHMSGQKDLFVEMIVVVQGYVSFERLHKDRCERTCTKQDAHEASIPTALSDPTVVTTDSENDDEPKQPRMRSLQDIYNNTTEMHLVCLLADNENITFEEAIRNKKWKEAMDE